MRKITPASATDRLEITIASDQLMAVIHLKENR